MSLENRDEMRSEYELRGAVRGKYLERYRRWTSITDATGTIEVRAVTSAGATRAEIVLPQVSVIYLSGPVLHGTRHVIASEEPAVAANNASFKRHTTSG